MKVELLCIDGCPNSVEAGERVRAALSELDLPGVEVILTVVETASDSKGMPFGGSPTITLDGVDIFPGAAPVSDLSCRIYQTPQGLAGLPTVDQIKQAFQDHGLS
ncbi:thioredoxin family protein [Arthrobacter sp. ISL-48]|uniref:thioredoxin family protein n=1 Tax=Arthrobacter sp. ISL-48 TaxID=2819110 RepID=UPI001BEBE796|nr:thioredoxin family protein [Arthrobacter sp. ISL-48]MBT2533416.1 thioredoxin family protein [Arthrobacter sp. ISL-48]